MGWVNGKIFQKGRRRGLRPGWTADGEIQRGHGGEPTGLLIARPNATILYSTLAKGPKLPPEHQLNSTRHLMRELNRLGLTSIIDADGGFQNYPEDYAIIDELHRRGELSLRIAMANRLQNARRQSVRCWIWAFRWVLAQTRRVSPAIIPLFHSIG